jgi:hypothetical protein
MDVSYLEHVVSDVREAGGQGAAALALSCYRFCSSPAASDNRADGSVRANLQRHCCAVASAGVMGGMGTIVGDRMVGTSGGSGHSLTIL